MRQTIQPLRDGNMELFLSFLFGGLALIVFAGLLSAVATRLYYNKSFFIEGGKLFLEKIISTFFKSK